METCSLLKPGCDVFYMHMKFDSLSSVEPLKPFDSFSVAMASPKRHKHGATKLLKIDFAKEFESRGLPLEDSF